MFNYKSMEIYFSDLNEDAKKRLLDFVGAETASDMNWDIDMAPIAIYDVAVYDDDNDEL